MNGWLLIVMPLIAAVIGWLANRMLVKLLLRKLLQKQPQLAQQIGAMAAQMVSFGEIEQKLIHPETIGKILPVAETHVDDFLHNKLKEAFPMIAMFIGERTIASLKAVFMKELESIFPVIISGYIQNLQNDLDLEQLVTEKIAAIPPEKLQAFFSQQLAKELRMLELAGAATGLVIGLLQVLIMLAVSR
jgi:uncharacterized membrane protein YheB (UPF0754 family)